MAIAAIGLLALLGVAFADTFLPRRTHDLTPWSIWS